MPATEAVNMELLLVSLPSLPLVSSIPLLFLFLSLYLSIESVSGKHLMYYYKLT